MTKKKTPILKTNLNVKKESIPAAAIKQSGFRIPYPALWLALIALALYSPTFFFQYTDLDDTIFIRNFAAYNEDLHNLIVSFQRGVFDVVKDPYYRPLFLDSMILNYQLSGQNIMGYHVVNVFLHIINVMLVYELFIKLNVKKTVAFILALIFAVHPVLSQAVAWIPGRNDTLLAVFTLSFFLCSINYAQTSKRSVLIFSAFFLLLAYFTKETAVFAAPVAFTLLVFVLQKKWLDRTNLFQYGIWIACFIIWFFVRENAIVAQSNMTPGELITGFIHRLPLIIQYIGKIFFPFNLSVFPIQEDTVYYYGFIAIPLLAVLLWLNKNRNLRIMLSGLAVFLLFLLPILFVPGNLNKETFEHRLYLPVIGILLLLSQSVLFQNKFSEKQIMAGGIIICSLLTFLNYRHQKNFTNPYIFWSSATETSPHSAYANMMLGARENNLQESYALFRKAYQLNPKEKYLNFYYGVMLQKQDSVPQSEKYLLMEKDISDYYECDYYLARVAAERKDFYKAIAYMESYLKREPNDNPTAYNNLLLLYLQTQQKEKAIVEVKTMQQKGIEVQSQIRQQLGL